MVLSVSDVGKLGILSRVELILDAFSSVGGVADPVVSRAHSAPA